MDLVRLLRQGKKGLKSLDAVECFDIDFTRVQ